MGFDDQRGFQCPHCEVVASRISNLRRHLEGSKHGLSEDDVRHLINQHFPQHASASSARRPGDGQVRHLVPGHHRALQLLGDTAAVRATLDRYRAALGTDVYLRMTGNGLTVMSLDAAGSASMIGVGGRAPGDAVLTHLPPEIDHVEAAVEAFMEKRSTLQRASDEERFSLELIAAALADRLRLPGTDWRFIHQEWRLTLDTGQLGKIDLLAVDISRRRLVVVELKASETKAAVPDSHGWDAAGQADAYADALWAGRAELYPFFSEVLRATAAVYASGDDLDEFELDPDQRPTTAVWWPDRTPPWPAWNASELQVAGDSDRVARYRRHQSRYRETVLGVGPGPRPHRPGELVGNVLDPAAVAANRRLNFIDDAAYRHAERRTVEVAAEDGTLDEDRLFGNLLSSMPMCFNIFGSLGATAGFTRLARALFDRELDEIDDVLCEVKPTDDLGDRTAFDAYITYRTTTGESRFVGIETKYTEPFTTTVYDNDHYRHVTNGSTWFRPGAAEQLKGVATNQLWRGLMLASLAEEHLGAVGRYIVICPADDDAALDCVRAVTEQLTEPDRLRVATLDGIVATARRLDDRRLSDWADRFEHRYLPDR